MATLVDRIEARMVRWLSDHLATAAAIEANAAEVRGERLSAPTREGL